MSDELQSSLVAALRKSYNHFSKRSNIPVKRPKNNQAARVARSKGYAFFLDTHYVNAIDAYNESLCLADVTLDPTSLGARYANRAEAYYNMALYAEALTSLEMATAAQYPDYLAPRLSEMAASCHKHLAAVKDKQKAAAFRVKLSYPANKRVPSVIEGIHVMHNKQFGRHLVTDRDLAVGDVIAMEQPFISCITAAMKYKRCTHCLSEERHRLFPCRGCVNAMFCSGDCERDAMQQYHSIECGISDALDGLEDSVRLGLRCFLVGVHTFGSVRRMRRVIRQMEGRNFSAFDIDPRTHRPVALYLAYHNGFSADAHFLPELRSRNLVRTGLLLQLLKAHTDLGASIRIAATGDFIMNILYHNITVNINNCYEIAAYSVEPDRPMSAGVGLYLVMSLASHACAANVMRMSKDAQQQVWIVTRPIARGSQILDNYGSCFTVQDLKTRQTRCRYHYGFVCQCEACVSDYPLYDDMACVAHVPEAVPSDQQPVDQHSSLDTFKRQLTQVADFIHYYAPKHYPCRQLYTAENELRNLFRHLLRSNGSLEQNCQRFHRDL